MKTHSYVVSLLAITITITVCSLSTPLTQKQLLNKPRHKPISYPSSQNTLGPLSTHHTQTPYTTHQPTHTPQPPQQTKHTTRSSQNTPERDNPTYEQVQQQQHQQMCNILGHASNIFSNFVYLVSKPNDQAHIGQQVGNIAQNIFHIVAEATKLQELYKYIQEQGSEQLPVCIDHDGTYHHATYNILDYLQSDEFAQALTQKIMEQLELT